MMMCSMLYRPYNGDRQDCTTMHRTAVASGGVVGSVMHKGLGCYILGPLQHKRSCMETGVRSFLFFPLFKTLF